MTVLPAYQGEDPRRPPRRIAPTVARCACGLLSLHLSEGRPVVVACHCTACQRRTGAPFGVGAYYDATSIAVSGGAWQFRRPTNSGGEMTNNFCPGCGTTVFWTVDTHPGREGVALGTIEDAAELLPERSVWERTKHCWIKLVAVAEHFEGPRLGARIR